MAIVLQVRPRARLFFETTCSYHLIVLLYGSIVHYSYCLLATQVSILAKLYLSSSYKHVHVCACVCIINHNESIMHNESINYTDNSYI